MANVAIKPSTHLRDILDKTIKPRHEPETEEAETLKASRPHMQAPMLDVVFRNGQIRSFNYAYLSEVEFQPGDTITVKFTSGAAIVIEGRGLANHRQQIRQHRADEIRECAENELQLQGEGVSQVEKIFIVEGDMQ